MKADLHCPRCEFTYHVKWNARESYDGGCGDDDDEGCPDRDVEEEAYPELCPFCGSSVEDRI
jgi:hypothetical protein